MKHVVYITIILCTLASCSNRQGAASSEADSCQAAADSIALRVAVMPAMSCLPVLYAEESGLDDSLGCPLTLLCYTAQLDIDTAIIRHHADIAFTDLIRAERLGSQASLTPFLSCLEPLSLVTQKRRRVKRIAQMKEQMIAISRLSATDFWCDYILDSTRTSHDAVYRPQINDVRLRAEMIGTGLMDAALMGEPYATWMAMLGNRRLFTNSKAHTRLYAWAACDSLSGNRQRAFRAVLDSATAILLGGAADTTLLHRILRQDYQLPPAVADSIVLPPPAPVSPIRDVDVAAAREWIRHRTEISKTRHD